MHSALMLNRHDDSELWNGRWTVAAGRAGRIERSAVPRRLAVTEGLLWLTRTADARAPSVDCWVGAGETIELPPGSEWVLEGRGAASFLLLEAPNARAAARPLSASARAGSMRSPACAAA